jgi:hypothetical protein
MQRIPKLQTLAILALALMLVFSHPVLADEMKGTLSSVAPDGFVFNISDENGADQQFRLRVDGKVMFNNEDMVATTVRCKRN